ncbi:hypothetical protein [Streptomyces inhibens]|uniref:hypothetical protein n=1 Tax=Streptomyces inhibens TaxID=2293571 RepID=UPI000FFB7BAD|nr:hypothetical protein [Streptomyces inhibens]
MANQKPERHWGAGKVVAVLSWAVVALVFFLVTVGAVTAEVFALNPPGRQDRVRITSCQWKSEGRGGTSAECTAHRVSGAGNAVVLQYKGSPGETVTVTETPGGDLVVKASVVQWVTAALFPMLPLAAAGVCAVAAVGAARRSGPLFPPPPVLPQRAGTGEAVARRRSQ